jgi:hypothetical protein
VSIAEKLDLNRETLRVWVRRAEVDQGHRPGVTTAGPRGRCGRVLHQRLTADFGSGWARRAFLQVPRPQALVCVVNAR